MVSAKFDDHEVIAITPVNTRSEGTMEALHDGNLQLSVGELTTQIDLLLVNHEQTQRKLATQVERYNDLVSTSIDSINEFDGCMEGKIEAAAAKGLVWRPGESWEVKFELTCSPKFREQAEALIDRIIRGDWMAGEPPGYDVSELSVRPFEYTETGWEEA